MDTDQVPEDTRGFEPPDGEESPLPDPDEEEHLPGREGEIQLPFEWAPVPRILHSEYAEGPFRTCAVCSESIDDGRLYEIQKVYHGREVIFEMAICVRCGEGVAKEFSRESMDAIKSFFLENLRIGREDDRCNFCGEPRTAAPRHNVCGVCARGHLLAPVLVMCEACEERIAERLSERTRRAQDDFMRDNFPGVPADLDLSPHLLFG